MPGEPMPAEAYQAASTLNPARMPFKFPGNLVTGWRDALEASLSLELFGAKAPIYRAYCRING